MTRIVALLFCSLLSLNAASWYVDNAASGANNGMSWANAWTNLGGVAWGSVAGGDTVYVSGGTVAKVYVAAAGSWINCNGAGSPAVPVRIRVGQEAGHNGQVVVDCAEFGNVLNGGYYDLDGSVSNSIHLTFTNSDKAIYGTECAAAVQSIGVCQIRYVAFRNVGTGLLVSQANGGEIAHCAWSDVRGNCAVRLTAGNTETFANRFDVTFLHENDVCLNVENWDGTSSTPGVGGPDGVQNQVTGCTFSNNIFRHAIGPVLREHPDYLQVQGVYTRIINNTFIDVIDSGIDLDSPNQNNVEIRGNVFYQVHRVGMPTAMRFYCNTDGQTITTFSNIHAVGNTFVDLAATLGNGGYVFSVGSHAASTVTNCSFQNNLIVNCGNANFGTIPVINISASSGFTFADWNIDYNLIARGAEGLDVLNVEGTYETQAHGFTNLPSFVSYTMLATNNNLRLSTNDTAALGKGLNFTAQGWTTDKDGVTRPSEGAWDLGAYQGAATGQAEPPVTNAPAVRVLRVGTARIGEVRVN